MTGKGNCTKDKYVFKLVIRFVAYVTKLRHFQANNYIYGSMLWSIPEYKAIRRAMQLRRNKLVLRSSYCQPQFSTMTEDIISGP